MSELSVSDPRQFWSYRDLAKHQKVKFGKMTGLWRCQFILCELLDIYNEVGSEETAPLGAVIVQSIKCLHQVALDHGDWSTAQWLLPTPDPSGRSDFGGDEQELRWIHAYKKSMKDLKAKVAKAEEEEDKGEDAKGSQKKK